MKFGGQKANFWAEIPKITKFLRKMFLYLDIDADAKISLFWQDKTQIWVFDMTFDTSRGENG